MQNELALRYSRISMDASDHAWFENYGKNNLTITGFKAESGLTAPMLGDGWIPQIQDNLIVDYNPNTGLDYKLLESLSMILGQRSPVGSSGNVFVIVGDTIVRAVLDTSFKKLIGWGNPGAGVEGGVMSNNIFDVKSGKENEIGFEITTYNYLGNKYVFIEDDLLNNPALFNTNGGVTGTGNAYILNASLVDGVSNFELFARSGRELIRKNENGMTSFDATQASGSVASSGFDGCSIHSLSELLPILYDVRSCAILRASAKYNGGSMSGNAAASGNYQAAQFLY